MGNLWDACCRAEEHDMDDSDPSKEQHLLTSALRIPSSLPSLQSKADLRRENRRVVRIESLSPMIEVDDEYESGSQFSEESNNVHNLPLLSGTRTPVTGSPTHTAANQLPKFSSGLRLLLANAALKVRDANDIEQKDESETKNEGNRGLRRVERHDSLHTVLPSDDQGVMFASAPVAAMKDPELPRGLTFGFLDDSAVARMHFHNTLRNSLFGSDVSFVRGSSINEAKNFPQEVIERKPDIVVLDNCLDYEVAPGVYQSLKGTDLAREIRQKGFEGCIILQSEQESLRNEVDFDVVDGITGKSKATSSFAIARMVALARRKHKISGGLNLPSSTTSSWNSRAESSFSFDIGEMDMRSRLELHDSTEGIGQ